MSVTSTDAPFRLYLPSNASADIFPTNTNSCYTTQLKKPIRLDGEWEVGVESICYNTDIGDYNESGTIQLTYSTFTSHVVNNSYPTKYKVLDNNKWDYSKRRLTYIPVLTVTAKDSKGKLVTKWKDNRNYIGNELKKAMNTASALFQANTTQPAIFTYTTNVQLLLLKTPYPGLAIQVSRAFAKLLGFGWRTIVTPGVSKLFESYYDQNQVMKMKATDYWIRIFDSAVVAPRARIILKHRSENALSFQELLRRWKLEQIDTKYNVKLKMEKQKAIFAAEDDKQCLVFNDVFHHFLYMPQTLIGKGEFWPDFPYGVKTKNPADHYPYEWIITIYGDDLLIQKDRVEHKHTLVIQPRHFHTVALCMEHMALTIKQWLQTQATKPTAVTDADVSIFQLTISPTTHHTELIVPKYMSITFTPNLLVLLGFDQRNRTFAGGSGKYTGVHRPTTLDELEQEIFIYTDIVEETNYGDSRASFLHHFLHNYPRSYGIVQQTFEPIVYLPLLHNFIGNVSIKLLTSWRECITIAESKTLLVLQFRRRH